MNGGYPLEPIDGIVEIIHRGRHLNAISIPTCVNFADHNPKGEPPGFKVVG